MGRTEWLCWTTVLHVGWIWKCLQVAVTQLHLNYTRLSLWFLRFRVCVVNLPSPAWWVCASQPAIQFACEDHPRVHVSDVSYSVTHTVPLDCQPFVHKYNCSWMFQSALPRSSCSEALLLISTSTNTEQSGFSWVDSALCYGFETKSLDVLQFLLMQCLRHIFPFKHNNYLWGSSVAT